MLGKTLVTFCQSEQILSNLFSLSICSFSIGFLKWKTMFLTFRISSSISIVLFLSLNVFSNFVQLDRISSFNCSKLRSFRILSCWTFSLSNDKMACRSSCSERTCFIKYLIVVSISHRVRNVSVFRLKNSNKAWAITDFSNGKKARIERLSQNEVAGPVGFEPTAYSLGGCRAIQFSPSRETLTRRSAPRAQRSRKTLRPHY